MSTIKVDTIATRTGSGNITLSNSLASATIAGDLAVDTSTLKVDAANNRVGIGTASPSQTLHVQRASSGGSAAAGAALIVEGTDATGSDIQILGDASDYQQLLFGDADDNDVGSIAYSHSSNTMRFQTNGSERMRILSGGGITFNGDTAAANALDDYEEGTWTPVLDFGNSTTGITYTTQSGIYRKIGGVVFFSFRMYLSSKGSATGHAHISGFPFTVGAMPTGGAFQLVPSRGWFGSGDEPMYIYFSNGGTRMSFYRNDWDGTANGASNEGQFANNSEIELTAMYFT